MNNLGRSGDVDTLTLKNINSRCKVVESNVNNQDLNFRLELFADKTSILPDEQIIFTAKLTYIGTSSDKYYNLGKVKCGSNDFDFIPDFKVNGDKDFFQVPDTNPFVCSSRVRDFLVLGSEASVYKKDIIHKYYSQDPANTRLKLGKINTGDHQAQVSFDYYVNGQKFTTLSNKLSFSVKENEKNKVKLKLTADIDKKIIKLGDKFIFETSVQNTGATDINFTSYQGSCLPPYVEFLVDGKFSNLQFTTDSSFNVRCYTLTGPLDTAYVAIKGGETKRFTLSDAMPRFLNNYQKEILPGTHYLQSRFIYKLPSGENLYFYSDKVFFKVEG